MRVVVMDAGWPGGDGAPLVGAGTGFMQQFEKPRHQRHRIEPVRAPANSCYCGVANCGHSLPRRLATMTQTSDLG